MLQVWQKKFTFVAGTFGPQPNKTVVMNRLHIISILCLILACDHADLRAQKSQTGFGAAPARAEFVSFDIREDANRDDRQALQFYVPFDPTTLTSNASQRSAGQIVDVLQFWNNRDMYLHIENPDGAYTLYINDSLVGRSTDTRTPVEYYISPYIRQGRNAIIVDIETDGEPLLSSSLGKNPRKPFENSYIYSQPKMRIYDYEVCFEPDSTASYGVLEIDIIAGNSYNYDETFTVGYDIYDPAGKLQDYNLREVTVAGRSVDTVHFKQFIYKTNQWRWSARTPHLYRLTLYTQANRTITEYIPLRIGFGLTEFNGSEILRNGEPVEIKAAAYNAAATRSETSKELKALKSKGINTIYVGYPQIYWFYDLCEEFGFYVIDAADINVSEGRDDRTVNGTPSNDPTLVGEYIDRVNRMYMRNRNRTCIIGWGLGHRSGNGYNMYKAYQWLKGLDDPRPVTYDDSDGEWNSDMDLPAAIR